MWHYIEREKMSKYYGMDGKEISEAKMLELFTQGNKKRQVADDTIGDVRISTVLLVIDHRFGEGPPVIFETMIFGGKLDQEQWRYSTKEEALEGHKKAVELVKKGGK